MLCLQTDSKSLLMFSFFSLPFLHSSVFSFLQPWGLFMTWSSLLFTASPLCHTGLPKTPLFTQLGETNHRVFNSPVCPTGELRLSQLAEDCKKRGKKAFGEDVFLFEAPLASTTPPSCSRSVTNQCSGRNCHSAAQ